MEEGEEDWFIIIHKFINSDPNIHQPKTITAYSLLKI